MVFFNNLLTPAYPATYPARNVMPASSKNRIFPCIILRIRLRISLRIFTHSSFSLPVLTGESRRYSPITSKLVEPGTRTLDQTSAQGARVGWLE